VNPQTGKPLDEGTLKKHFPREIAVGAAELHARMGSFMVATSAARIAANRRSTGSPRKMVSHPVLRDAAVCYLGATGSIRCS